MEQHNSLTVFVGQTQEIVLPSGAIAVIREHSAADDDILTTSSKGKTDGENYLHNLNRYVASILQNKPYEPSSSAKPTVKDVELLRLKDKHYIIFSSRMFSIGETLDVNHKCGNEECKQSDEYEVDLKQYDRDLTLTYEELEAILDDDKLAIMPYREDYTHLFFEVVTPSGLKVKLEYLNGLGENFMLAHSRRNTSVASTSIIARRPQVEVNGEWREIKNINVFSKKDIISINKAIDTHDKQFPMSALIECAGCGNQTYLPLIAVKDFFFPGEI